MFWRVLTGLLLALPLVAAWAAGITVSDARVTEAPPGTPVAGGFLTLRNDGAEKAVLTGAVAHGFERVEIHRSERQGDRVTMRHVESVEIAAGSTLAFAPGSWHLMLFGEPPLPRAGEMVTITLHFADGGSVTVEAPVVRPGSGHAHHAH